MPSPDAAGIAPIPMVPGATPAARICALTGDIRIAVTKTAVAKIAMESRFSILFFRVFHLFTSGAGGN
jgi:hypothetical protein